MRLKRLGYYLGISGSVKEPLKALKGPYHDELLPILAKQQLNLRQFLLAIGNLPLQMTIRHSRPVWGIGHSHHFRIANSRTKMTMMTVSYKLLVTKHNLLVTKHSAFF